MLEEKILEDYKQALKAKDAEKVSTISFLRSQMKNLAIDKRQNALTDEDVISVLRKLVKQRRDSIEQFKAGNRQDLVEKEAKELEILLAYLPQQVSDEKMKEIIEEVVKATGATSIQDMGKVMKELMAKFAGRSDNKLVSELVRQRLTQG
ncbi:MAG: glutamyl-tRNA amidotransferase [Omnitrophica WOR_2 bacterium GWF2_43_52]|nr:MAG: glutamyl-tRNA amidotransferase [Omnitrophica WOR_2 bacterium GWA2_44_7]OGX15987.1 MAG: glutamyl-tRNA amidotransferase [Omnitrophica WOR_2 bacterium GWC2_44_8]OGX20746.1 MAG: glutamyl-tRNA amidotransferase [Omnitrophica WOR_2 bacterium GWF2_43_52]OGX58616.1 MAG: glutamyl-tRNA amidotransferase [Omnitrophica WOR_2 bacterium RIFOXYC2_FULL_43_9]HAH19767.1 glutamyl-tRNA amidotransferase [Candidatus Omnitrophota bacterium]